MGVLPHITLLMWKQYTNNYTICEQYDMNPVNIIDADPLAPYGIDNVANFEFTWFSLITALLTMRRKGPGHQ